MGRLELQICSILLIFQFKSLFGQQEYRQNRALDCLGDQYKGYVCNGPQISCQSLLTFRSHPPYDSPLSIANLLASEALEIASINRVSSQSYTFPPDTLVTVPISCSCWGDSYLHNAPYTIQKGQTYFVIANNTFQGLTACQTVAGTNEYYFDSNNLTVGSQIMVPVTCACPSYEQAAYEVSSLLVYMITWGDSFSSISELFGVSLESLFKANNLTENDLIYPFTPLLVPLKNRTCSAGRNFLCEPLSPAPSIKLVTILGVCIGIGFVCSFFACYCLYQYLKQRRHKMRKEKLFMRNGGHLLQKRLASNGSSAKLKLFTAEELEKATDNYSKSRFLGQGGYGNVYKGMLLDGTIVAVKRSKSIDKTRTEQFINEVVILSQINHRNVVKLLGSCLETEFPLLVYEFISNGSLSDHIYCQENESESLSLSWDVRLRIACEVAGAVAYMHSAASIPIFHRDIKSSNILLDDKYSAKVSDFGTSRSVPCDKTHFTTAVQGTFGYLDPEYFQSSQFTDKSDVYSFGVVLVELLTGQKPVSLARESDEERNIVVHFISMIKEDRLPEILDTRIAGEVSKHDGFVIAKLAKRCLRLNGKKRPTMKEVAMELENLVRSQTCLDICQENETLLKENGSGSDSEDDDNDGIRQTFFEESVTNILLDMETIFNQD